MIIIIDEASAKLASFYYHDEIFKPEWKRAVEMTSASQELYDELQEKLQEKLPDELWEKLYVALPADESIKGSPKTITKGYTEYADNVVRTSTGNLKIPETVTDCIWIVSNRQQKKIADSLGIASIGEPQCGTRYAVESLAELDIEYLERVRRRYNHIPWDIGETERCLIRELSLSDLPALYELYDKPGMTDYVEPLYDYETELEYQKAYIENMYGF